MLLGTHLREPSTNSHNLDVCGNQCSSRIVQWPIAMDAEYSVALEINYTVQLLLNEAAEI